MKLKIGETLRELRKQKGISQEALAEYYQVSIDYLLTGKSEIMISEVPNDDVLRVVQLRGRTVLRQDQYDANVKIPLLVDKEVKQELHVEIWGSAEINGNVTGNVQAGNSVNCGNVGGNVDARDLHCHEIQGDVNCQGNIYYET